jgi:hypothetical protein
MTEPDVISRKIHELKDWQTIAWRRVADGSTTVFERREIRNHIKESDAELRCYLGMMSDRLRFQDRGVKDIADSFADLRFKLLLGANVRSASWEHP